MNHNNRWFYTLLSLFLISTTGAVDQKDETSDVHNGKVKSNEKIVDKKSKKEKKSQEKKRKVTHKHRNKGQTMNQEKPLDVQDVSSVEKTVQDTATEKKNLDQQKKITKKRTKHNRNHNRDRKRRLSQKKKEKMSVHTLEHPHNDHHSHSHDHNHNNPGNSSITHNHSDAVNADNQTKSPDQETAITMERALKTLGYTEADWPKENLKNLRKKYMKKIKNARQSQKKQLRSAYVFLKTKIEDAQQKKRSKNSLKTGVTSATTHNRNERSLGKGLKKNFSKQENFSELPSANLSGIQDTNPLTAVAPDIDGNTLDLENKEEEE